MDKLIDPQDLENFTKISEDDFEIKDIIKLVFLGDSGVGKTNIMQVFNNGTFNINSKSTIGVDFALKAVRIREHCLKLQIWDTAGQERYRTFTSAYFKDSHGLLLVYDITNRKSFENIDTWLKTAYQHINKEKTSIILLGNKIDKEEERKVSRVEAEDFAQQNNFLFMETSALDNRDLCITRSFYRLLDQIIGKYDFPDDDDVPRLAKRKEKSNLDMDLNDEVSNDKLKKKKCC